MSTTTCPRCKRVHAAGRPCAGDGVLPTLPLDKGALPAIADVGVATPADLAPGDAVGEYRIVGVLGRGGFGVVYQAVQPVIGKNVAIKVLDLRFSSDPAFVSRFVAEARAVNQIHHRHIIDIFSFGQLPDGRQYYVMELLRGVTLARYVRDRGKISPADTVTLLAAIARALDAAHAGQIAHRDLKPDNIFIVDDEGRPFPKLLDFGVAKLLGARPGEEKSPTLSGGIVGTPPYMSPEQCKGGEVDHRTDVYSLGVIAFEMLTGRLPFDGESDTEVMWKHISTEPPRPSEIEPSLAALDAPLLGLLAKKPDRRPASAGEAVRGLAEAAGVTLPAAASRSSLTPIPLPAVPDAATAPTVATPHPRSLVAAEARPSLVTAQPARGRRTKVIMAAGAAVIVAAALAIALVPRGEEQAVAPAPPPATTRPAPPEPSPTPAPPAVVTPPPPAVTHEPPPPPAVPATVAIEIRGTPAGTDVLRGAEVIGTAPGTITLPRGDAPVTLTFEKRGYQDARHTVVPDADRAIKVELRRARSAKPRGGGEIPEW